MNILRLEFSEVRKFIIIFYAVGIIGFSLPFAKEYFTYLTPFSLLITMFLLYKFHEGKLIAKDLIVFSIIFVLGYSIEVAGVATKLIFGDYSYGHGLGLKVLDTPLLIGLNWLYLTYCFASIANRFKLNRFITPLIAATLMVVYDLILEQVAGYLEMWYWHNNVIPLQNYLVWFAVSLVMQYILFWAKVETKNKLAPVVIIAQSVFFILIYLIGSIFYV